ncbi:maltokinase [Raineyella antarctica]|uniref:Maltokinase n=1 Tax=Raineyella antarctica TaxID=1577474 RepID=A0A1G6GTU9_9ACTN|nr:phosphotransferase [Raineyella antarctica]SDB85442.1 maltokinase [Raineyella antarctica]
MVDSFDDLATRALGSARWYAGKGRPLRIIAVTALPWYGEGPGRPGADEGTGLVGVRPVLVTVGHDDVRPADVDTYQFLLAVRHPGRAPAPGSYGTCADRRVTDSREPLEVADATQDPEAMAMVLAAISTAEKPDPTPGGTIRHHSLVELPHTDLSPHPFRGEQSNTSVFFGDALMLKVFRRLEAGHNLDIAVHAALGKDNASSTAVLYGWTEGHWRHGTDETTADLAMLVERFREAEDGWDLACAACTAGEDFATEAAALGRALREVHEGLARHFPTARVDAGPIGARMGERLDQTCGIAPQLLPYGTGLGAIFAALDEHVLDVQHVHGDFHLGQVLRTPDGWRVIDFEGEPLKTLTERWAPDSPWRDVAGMLRSFDYAAATGAQLRTRAAAAAGDPGSAGPGLTPRQWRQNCRDSFLEAYHQGTPTGFDLAVLRAYEADKAVYEVVYEIRNRPDWVSIPLGAVAELVSPSPITNDGQSPIHEEK